MIDYLDKINALVAEHVMGWVDVAYVVGGYGDGRNNTEEGPWYEWRGRRERKEWVLSERIPSFSTRIDLAWQVLDAVDLDWKMEPHYVEFEELVEQADGPMYYEPIHYRHYLGQDEEMPLAICLAALKAVKVALPSRSSGTTSSTGRGRDE